MKNTPLAFVFIILFAFSCKQRTDYEQNKKESISKMKDSTLETQSYKVDSQLLFLANEAYNNDERTKVHVDQLKETWKNFPKEVQATFLGADFGDYFHITFIDKDGNYMDFGDANNNFTRYNLILESNDADSRYVNKKFKLKWEWMPSSFNCCEGNMDEMIALVPTITYLELIEK